MRIEDHDIEKQESIKNEESSDTDKNRQGQGDNTMEEEWCTNKKLMTDVKWCGSALEVKGNLLGDAKSGADTS